MTIQFVLSNGEKYQGLFGPGASRRFKRWAGYRLAEIEEKGDESDFGALAFFSIQVWREIENQPPLEMTADQFIDRMSFADIQTIGEVIATMAEDQEKNATTPANRAARRKAKA
jgi:hypothetical protein